LRTMESFMPCPNASCVGGHFHEAGVAEPIFTCEVCKSKYCVACNAPWHKDMTCKEFARKRVVDEKKKVQEAKKRSRCYHQFCWVCLWSWTRIVQHDNHFHEPLCKQYRPRRDLQLPPIVTDPPVVTD
ncbi:uncharacterized protein BDZ99DRAFT_378381, partial [Mytilinidion resinicola]